MGPSSRSELGTVLQEGVDCHSSWTMRAETTSRGNNGFHAIAIAGGFELLRVVVAAESVVDEGDWIRHFALHSERHLEAPTGLFIFCIRYRPSGSTTPIFFSGFLFFFSLFWNTKPTMPRTFEMVHSVNIQFFFFLMERGTRFGRNLY